MAYFLNAILWMDHTLLRVLTLDRCKRGEYISSALWSLEGNQKIMGIIFRPVVDWLVSPFQKDHCFKSWRGQREIYEAFDE